VIVPAERRRVLDLATVLVHRDLRLSYGGAAFGLLWAPATVLAQVAVLGFLFDRVVPLGIDDYLTFLLSGLLVWHLVSSALNGSTGAFTANRDLVRRPGFPDAVLPLVTVGRAAAGYALALPVLLVAVAVTGRLAVTALALPVILLATLVLLGGPAYVVAVLNVRHRDVDHLTRVLLGIAFYATPVFYPEERLPDGWAWLSDLNPFAAVVTLHRQVLYSGEWPSAGRLLALAAWAVAGLAVAGVVHRRSAWRLADDL
jgi:lipopolysaccharide transport system permease protein